MLKKLNMATFANSVIILVISILLNLFGSVHVQETSALFPGRYRLYYTSANFDKFLEQIGVNFFLRSLATTVSHDYVIKQNASAWSVRIESSLKNSAYQFQDGVPFVTTRMDGKTVRTVVNIVGNDKWIQKQFTTPEAIVEREFLPNEMKVTFKTGNVAALRKYKRVGK